MDRLQDELSYDSFTKWLSYFENRPVNWRDDDRFFKLLAAWGQKGKPYDIFPSLVPIYQPVNRPKEADNTLDINKFRQSFMYSKMLSAKDGKRLEL